MPYKAVIFDLFGTLVDSFKFIDYSQVLRETSSILKIPHDDFMRLWGSTAAQRSIGTFKTLEDNLSYICRELNVPATKSQINLAKMIKYDYVALALTPRPGAIEVLSQIKSGGYKIALVSNCSSEPPVIWPHTAMAPFFDVTVFSATAGIQKPDPRIYLMVTEQVGVKPTDCLYVGDNSSGELNGALKAGMHPVILLNPEEHEDTHAMDRQDDWQGPAIKSLTEILDLLKD
ncbi:MAG: HAD family hydrolase [Dehalococcoidales bacterium]